MPVTTKNTNYGDIRQAHRHHITPPAPVAVRAPVEAPKPVEPAIIPTAVKAAAVTEQNSAIAAKAAADAAKVAAAPATHQPSGPIPSPFDVLGKAAPETKAEAKANKAAAKEAAHGTVIDDDPEKDWIEDRGSKPN